MNNPLEGFDLSVPNNPIEVKNFRGKVFPPTISRKRSVGEEGGRKDLVRAVRMDMQGVNPMPAPVKIGIVRKRETKKSMTDQHDSSITREMFSRGGVRSINTNDWLTIGTELAT